MTDHTTQEQARSWWDRLQFLHNEVQAEMDVCLDPPKELAALRDKINESRAALQAFAEKKRFKLF